MMSTTNSSISDGGSTAGPAVDVSRPASELSGLELRRALAEWMGWRRMTPPWKHAAGGYWLLPPEGEDVGFHFEGWEPAALDAEPFTDPEPWLPAFESTHEGAAALRVHVRSRGPEDVARYVRTLFEAVGVDEPSVEAAEFAVLDASPLQQARAAYEAFIRQSPST